MLLVFCNCPSLDIARKVAHALLEARLVACVSILPLVHSIYRWQDEVCEEQEIQLQIKTISANFEAVKSRLLAMHPYELPEVIAVPLSLAHADYLTWVESCCAPLKK